jgi:uncharacterized membrane protein
MKMVWVLQYVLMAVVVGVGVLAVVRRRQAGAAAGVVRSASLKEPNTRGLWLWLLSSLLPVAIAAAVLAVRWDAIPQRFAQHWTMAGVHTSDLVANRFVERSMGSVFGLLVMAVGVVLLMGVMGEMMTRSSPGFVGRETMLRVTRDALLACAWLVSLLFSAVSLLPLCAAPETVLPVVMALAIVGTIGLVGWLGYRAVSSGALMAAAAESTDARFWKAGVFYVNPNDSALLVPKRYGFGYTLNFGRPVAWVLMAVILAGSLWTVVLALHRAHQP